MSLSENGNDMVMPVSPMYGSGNSGFGWGDGGLFWIIILFLFAFMGNGWGNMNQPTADVQRGFDQQAVMSGLGDLNASMSNGFANAEVSRCNAQANLLGVINANQNAQIAAMNNLAMGLQNCCCENRAATADLKYTVATEACADRSAVNDALRDVIASNSANTQRILDQMCQDKIDAKNEEIASLRTQLSMKDLAASQTAQTAQIIADNAYQTQALEHYLNPAPIPAYMVQNPNCCGQSFYNGYGCNAA